jgi:hypothetical protein
MIFVLQNLLHPPACTGIRRHADGHVRGLLSGPNAPSALPCPCQNVATVAPVASVATKTATSGLEHIATIIPRVLAEVRR